MGKTRWAVSRSKSEGKHPHGRGEDLLVEWLPIFQTAIRDFTARAKGEEIDGMRYDADRGGWVPSHIKVKDPWYKRFRDWLRSPAPDLRDIWTRGATRAYRY